MQKVNKDTSIKVTIKTFFGLENVLMEELVELGYPKITKLNRAVQVEVSSWRDIYFLNLHLRCALSVLVEIASFDIKKEADLYHKCMQIDWTSYFTVDKTFAVKGAVFTDIFSHTQYPFLLVKDAIVDTFRKMGGNRPDVNSKSPQVLFDLHISNQKVTLSVNSSGAPLFQRGYREATGEAPLNEVVAAALIRMSGWDKKTPFIDPFCGSGTLLIEAALYATGIPSSIERQHYAFKNFKNFDATCWDTLWQEATKRILALPCRIIGSDKNAEMVTKARRNLRRLAIGRFVETSVSDFSECLISEETGHLITNPPYGLRLEADTEALYQRLGDWMKQSLQGYSCWILSASESGFKALGLKPEKKYRVFNGELECSFRSYTIFKGSRKEFTKSESKS